MKSLKVLALLFCAFLTSNAVFAEATELSQDAFEKLTKDNPKTVILDVRTVEEYANGYIKGAVNTPHTDAEKVLAAVNKDDTIVMYCRSGRRANMVAEMLKEKGFNNLYTLEGDIKSWIENGKPLEGVPNEKPEMKDKKDKSAKAEK